MLGRMQILARRLFTLTFALLTYTQSVNTFYVLEPKISFIFFVHLPAFLDRLRGQLDFKSALLKYAVV